MTRETGATEAGDREPFKMDNDNFLLYNVFKLLRY